MRALHKLESKTIYSHMELGKNRMLHLLIVFEALAPVFSKADWQAREFVALVFLWENVLWQGHGDCRCVYH